RLFLQPEKLQNERVLDQISRFFHHLALLRQPANFPLVAAQRQTLVQRTADLTLQLAYAPAVGLRLDLVKSSLVRAVYGEKRDIVGPAETKIIGQCVAYQRQVGWCGFWERREKVRR